VSGQKHGLSAFSLIEVLLAVVVLSLGSLALFSLMFSALQVRSKSTEEVAAYNLATSELERVLQVASQEVSSDEHTRFWGQDFPGKEETFRRSEVKVGGTSFDVVSHTRTVRNKAQGSNRIKKIETEVSWFGKQKRGQGNLSVRVEKLVGEP
jgi:Tfp pilus assembly protein PilV